MAPSHLTTGELSGCTEHVAWLLDRPALIPAHLRGSLGAWLAELRAEADERAATEVASRASSRAEDKAALS